MSFTVIKRIPNPLRGDRIVSNYGHFYGATGEGSLLWFVTGSQLCPLPDVLDCSVAYNLNRIWRTTEASDLVDSSIEGIVIGKANGSVTSSISDVALCSREVLYLGCRILYCSGFLIVFSLLFLVCLLAIHSRKPGEHKLQISSMHVDTPSRCWLLVAC